MIQLFLCLRVHRVDLQLSIEYGMYRGHGTIENIAEVFLVAERIQ